MVLGANISAIHQKSFRTTEYLRQVRFLPRKKWRKTLGIPCIDIIDFDYPYWHTAGDLPEQCSAESLAQVGRVVTAWLAKPKNQPIRPLH